MNKEQLKELIEKEGDELLWSHTCSNGVIIDCSILRNTMLALCGYITLTPDNTLYGIGYDDLDLHAHGGLTYNSYDEDNWIIGFDCAHYQDLCPYYILKDDYDFGQRGTYRDMKYVKSECENLAEQASKFSKSIVRYNKISQII